LKQDVSFSFDCLGACSDVNGPPLLEPVPILMLCVVFIIRV
jgi:hypothetical protein